MGTPERLKIDVLLLLFERPEGVPLDRLPEEFLCFHRRCLDLQAHGYSSLAALIGDMSGMVEVWEGPHSLRLLARVPGSAGPRRGTLASPRPSGRPEPRPCLLPAGPPAPPCGQGAGLLGSPFWAVPGAFGTLPFAFPLWSPLRPNPRAQAWVYTAPRTPPASRTGAGGRQVAGGAEARQGAVSGPPPDEGLDAGPAERAQGGGTAEGESRQLMTYSQALRSSGGRGCKAAGVGGGGGGVGGGGGAGQLPERRLEASRPRRCPLGVAEPEGPAGAQGRGEETQPHSKIPAGRSEEPAMRPGGLHSECPVKEWLLSVLSTRGYRDGLYSSKLATLCLKQVRLELSDFLKENGYGSLEEVLYQVPEVETVPRSGSAREVVVRLRAGAEPAVSGRGLLTTEAGPLAQPSLADQGRATFWGTDSAADLSGTSGHRQLQLQPVLETEQVLGQNQTRRGRAADGTGPSLAEAQRAPATDGPVSEGTREKLARVLAQHPGGLSPFQLRQEYRDLYSQALAPVGHPTLGALLGAMGDTVSIRGLGVQARLFPGQSQLTDPFKGAGNGHPSAMLPEKTITETGFRALEGLSSGPARPS